MDLRNKIKMELKIENEKNVEPILSRKEYSISMKYDGKTPSNKDITEKCAKLLKSDETVTLVKRVDNKFGHQNAIVTVYVYTSLDEMKKIEKCLPKEEKKEE